MNNYHIYEEIGRGKHSVVYKGRKKKTIEYVAVKSVERYRRKKLMNEVRIFHNLDHKNVLKFHNWYETRNHLWIIFEYCPAGDLSKLMQEDGKLSEKNVKQFAFEMLEGLSYLHENGIIFQDLKPANILINEFCQVKLADFGLSKKISDLIQPNMTETEQKKENVGSPYYMAPEQFLDEAVLSYYSDFWSLGIVLYEMATGKVPFAQRELNKLIKSITEDQIQTVPNFSEDFNDLLKRLLKKDPIERITWHEIKQHPFWYSTKPVFQFKGKAIYPEQPQFDRYLQSRGINPVVFYDQQRNPIANKFLESQAFSRDFGSGMGGVDILRLSMNVKRNLIKEREESTNDQCQDSDNTASTNYHAKVGAKGNKNGRNGADSVFPQNQNQEQENGDDIKLIDKNIVLNFGETQAEEENGEISQNLYENKSQSTTAISQNQPQNGQFQAPISAYKVNDETSVRTQDNFFYSDSQKNNHTEDDVPEESQNIFMKDRKNDGSQIVGQALKEGVKQNNFMEGLNQHDNKVVQVSNVLTHNQVPVQMQKANSTTDQKGQPLTARPQIAKGDSFGPPGSINNLSKPAAAQQHSAQKQIYHNTTTASLFPQSNSGDLLSKTSQLPQSTSSLGLGSTSTQHQTPQQQQYGNNLTRRSATKNKPLGLQYGMALFQYPQDLALLSEKQIAFQGSGQQDLYSLSSQPSGLSNPIDDISSNPSSNSRPQTATLAKDMSQRSMMNKTGSNLPVGMEANDSAVKNADKHSKVPHKPIEQLIIHNSDNQVKPIIGNKDIEKVSEIKVNPQSLPFQPWDVQQIAAKIDTQEIESHLSQLYQALQNNQIVNDKINALTYFESIIVSSNVSNRLINSAFMNLLVKMLKSNNKVPGLKSRLCSVIGLLIRHSTVIDNELAESDICAALVDTMKDQTVKVRRKAIAALGEYMFYAATQLDDEAVDPNWELSYESIQVILRSLRISQQSSDQEDDIVRFYSCKTLENICAQSKTAGQKFATLETINHLLSIFLCPTQNMSKSPQKQPPQFYEALKTSSAVALSHIVSLNPQLFQPIFEQITVQVYCQTLIEGAPRVQQAFITMLNLAITANVFPKISDVLLSEDNFLPALLRLHEHNSIVIRGKCLLTFLLLFRLDVRWMAVVQNQVKFFNTILERVLKDNYKYVQCCFLCLIDGILEIVPTIFQNAATELMTLIQGEGQTMPQKMISHFDKFMTRELVNQFWKGGNLFYISIIVDLQTNQLIRNRMLNGPFIRSLSVLLDNVTILIASSVTQTPANIIGSAMDQQGVQGTKLTEIAFEFQYSLLLIAESISSNSKVIFQMHDSIIQFLLPVLLAKIRNPSMRFNESSIDSQERESRFLSLKIITDIITQLLNEEAIYMPHQSLEGTLTQTDKLTHRQQMSIQSTKKINYFLTEGLIPLAAHLLSQTDLEPFYGQRLLSVMLEKNLRILKVIRNMKSTSDHTQTQDQQQKSLLQIITDFYQYNHNNLNKHTIVIVKYLIENKELSFQEMRDYKVIYKTSQLIQTMLANKKEWCIELLLDINHHLLSRLNEVIKTREKEIAKHIDDIFANFDTCVQLLSDQFEVAIIEKASQCLIQMLQLYAQCQEKKREIFFVETHMNFLIKAIDCQKKTIQKRVLKCIYWALIQSEYQIEMDATKVQHLSQKIDKLLTSTDKSIVSTAKSISKILQDQVIFLQNNANTMIKN